MFANISAIHNFQSYGRKTWSCFDTEFVVSGGTVVETIVSDIIYF